MIVKSNGLVMNTLRDSLTKGGVPLDSFLDTETWEVLQSHVAPFLDDPEVVRDVSAYFSNLQIVSRIVARYIDLRLGEFLVGIDPSKSMAEFLPGRFEQLIGDGERVVRSLEEAMREPVQKRRIVGKLRLGRPRLRFLG